MFVSVKVPYIHDMPTIQPFWAAGFSFARGHFVVNVPYDQHLREFAPRAFCLAPERQSPPLTIAIPAAWIFQGEEISIGLRGFSYGYDYYSAERSVCYHYYGRQGVPMFWENSRDYGRAGRYGMNRLNAIIGMTPPGQDEAKSQWLRTDRVKYGMGRVRTARRFFDIFGIHTDTQTVEKHLCSFVGQPMQRMFIPFLRENGMGLDYNKITYRFKDNSK